MNNRKQGIKTITISAVIIQVITVLITIYIYMEQQNVKKIFSAAEEVIALKSVPIDYLIINTCPAVLYLIFLGYLMAPENKSENSKAVPAVFFGLCCLMKIVLNYIPRLSGIFISCMGVTELASHSVLSSAVEMAVSPLSLVAFGLFCLAVGGCLWGGKDEKAVL